MKKLKKANKDTSVKITKQELLIRLNILEGRIRDLESEVFLLRQKNDEVGLLGPVLLPVVPNSAPPNTTPTSCPACNLSLLESRVCMSTACPFANQVTCTC